MAFVLNDRVLEISTTTGTGDFTLGGPPSGYQSFNAGIGTSNTTFYAAFNTTANEWELGLGTLSGATTLQRTTIYSSSNSNNAVNFSAGTKNVFVTMPASQTLTTNTSNTFTAAQTFRAANAVRSEAASTQDAVVIAGRAGGTSSYAITLTPDTLSASRTYTFSDPGANVTVGYLNIPQNSQSTAYTLVATDSGKQILHPSADTTARIFTIPANSSVPFAVGTAITFINQNGAGVVTIAITSDTMRLAGPGTTGSRTLAANGIATAIKVTSTEWIISGVGLT